LRKAVLQEKERSVVVDELEFWSVDNESRLFDHLLSDLISSV
jgi:hypothetical protein